MKLNEIKENKYTNQVFGDLLDEINEWDKKHKNKTSLKAGVWIVIRKKVNELLDEKECFYRDLLLNEKKAWDNNEGEFKKIKSKDKRFWAGVELSKKIMFEKLNSFVERG